MKLYYEAKCKIFNQRVLLLINLLIVVVGQQENSMKKVKKEKTSPNKIPPNLLAGFSH